jgi:hypothetical protein
VDHRSKRINLPPEVEAVFREFRTCEMSTLARDGTPITWPTLPFWRPEEGRFLITTSIGLPHKAFNVRRQPASGFYSGNPITRYLLDWYYMRLTIHVTPRRILWWPGGDFERSPLEVNRVG